jgi:hypothetical protein
MNEKKMFYTEHNLSMMFFYDVLEQFNIESFTFDIIDCIGFLFLVIFLGGLYFYDIWLGLSFFTVLSICLLFNSTTSNFILLVY